MSNRQAAAQRVAEFINTAEQSLDEALARTSVLVSELPALQRDAGLNAAWAQPAVVSICSAMSDLASARASLIEAHKSLSAVQRKIGVTVLESPNHDKPPETKPFAPRAEAPTIVPIAA